MNYETLYMIQYLYIMATRILLLIRNKWNRKSLCNWYLCRQVEINENFKKRNPLKIINDNSKMSTVLRKYRYFRSLRSLSTTDDYYWPWKVGAICLLKNASKSIPMANNAFSKDRSVLTSNQIFKLKKKITKRHLGH